jgi:hypothetical protein
MSTGYRNVLQKKKLMCEILGFRRGVVEVFALVGCYVALVRCWLPTFLVGLSVPKKKCRFVGSQGKADDLIAAHASPHYHLHLFHRILLDP